MEFILGDDEIKKSIREQEIMKEVVTAIQGLPNFKQRKMDMNLLNCVMNMIENLVKKKYCLDKKLLLKDIYVSLFGKLTPEEESSLDKNIEFILKSGVVVKYGKLYKLWLSIKKYFRG